MSKQFKSFSEFYPFYLEEHANRTCRLLHFIGSWLVLLIAGYAAWKREPVLIWLLPVVGYGFAWAGHFFFEHNRPATFKYPFYSFAGDWVMWKDMMTGKIKI